MSKIGLLGCGVDHKAQPPAPVRVRKPRDDEIIENTAVLVEQKRIAHLARNKRGDVARHERLEGAGGICTFKQSLPHMRNIKKSGRRAGKKMLFGEPPKKLPGQGGTRETQHSRAKADMQIIEG